jgi:hypothetical protein
MEPDKSQLIEALKFHPRGAEKIGVGVREIKVIINDACFFEITFFPRTHTHIIILRRRKKGFRNPNSNKPTHTKENKCIC